MRISDWSSDVCSSDLVALFAEGADQLAAPDGARRCEYAASATELSLDASRLVLDDWVGGFRATFATGVDGLAQASVSALPNEVTFALQLVDDHGLRPPAEAQPEDGQGGDGGVGELRNQD